VASLEDGADEDRGERVEREEGADIEVGEEENDRSKEPRTGGEKWERSSRSGWKDNEVP